MQFLPVVAGTQGEVELSTAVDRRASMSPGAVVYVNGIPSGSAV